MTFPQYTKYDIVLNLDVLSIIETLHYHQYEAYLVGGAIRDILEAKTPKDYDIVTNATPVEIVKLFKFARLIGKRFQIVHIYLNRKKFIEVSTYRGLEHNTQMLRRDNSFGTMDTDAHRRDFTINSLYYDILAKHIIDWHGSLEDMKHKLIAPIGNIKVRFTQDPVRILRAIRFMNKLDFSLHPDIYRNIQTHKDLLLDIPPARLFEECSKLFISTSAYQNYKTLVQFGIFSLLFPNTSDNPVIKVALLSTEKRLQQNLPNSVAFIFVIFLFDHYKDKFAILAKTYKNQKKASDKAMDEVLYKQNKRVHIPQFAMQKIINVWSLQYKLESMNAQCSSKDIKDVMAEKDFRMAFDFLLIRSKVSTELASCANFWHNTNHQK